MFILTQMDNIPNHVVNRVKTDPECWSQLMDHCQELAHLTNLGNHMMGAITKMRGLVKRHVDMYNVI
jgi:hypothetical protein